MKVRLYLLICSTLLVCKTHAICTSIEVNGFYNRPDSSVLRKIYGSSWGGFEFGATVGSLYNLNFWIAQGVLQNDGYSLGGKQPTDITILPLTIGLKYILPWWFVQPYVGAAPRIFFVQINNESNFVKRKENFTAVGGGFRGGVYFFFQRNIFANVYVDYSVGKKHFSGLTSNNVIRHSLNLNSLSVGGGLGVAF